MQGGGAAAAASAATAAGERGCGREEGRAGRGAGEIAGMKEEGDQKPVWTGGKGMEKSATPSPISRTVQR